MPKKSRDEVKDQTVFTAADVREFMRVNQMTVEMLADTMGVTKQAVTYWITGQRHVPETTKRIFVFFQTRPEMMRYF